MPIRLTNPVWWFILCVSLTSLRDSQIADKILFLDVSVKVFLEETGIWIGELNKAEGLLQCGWAWSDLLKAQIEKKSEERQMCWDKSELSKTSISPVFRSGTLDSQAFGLRSRLNHQLSSPLPFSGLWTHLNYNISFLGSPAHRERIVGLHSFHDHRNQFL